MASRAYTEPKSRACQLVAALAASGALLGIRTSLPGPSSQEEVRKNVGESLAADSGMILTDTLLVTLQHPRLEIDDEEFRAAREDLFDLLKTASSAHTESPLFKVVQTPGHTWLPSDRLVSPDQKSVLFLAETAVPRSMASGAMGDLPGLLTDWSSRHPSFQLHYLSNGTADNEIFQLIDSDLDNSLIFTLPHQAALATPRAIVPAVAWSGVTVALSIVGLLFLRSCRVHEHTKFSSGRFLLSQAQISRSSWPERI